jgi:hypothetical protein
MNKRILLGQRGIAIFKDQIEKIKKESSKTGASIAHIIRVALDEYIKKNKERG